MKVRDTEIPKKITANSGRPYSYSFSGLIAMEGGRTSLQAKQTICSSYQGKWIIQLKTTSKLHCAIEWMQDIHKDVLKLFSLTHGHYGCG